MAFHVQLFVLNTTGVNSCKSKDGKNVFFTIKLYLIQASIDHIMLCIELKKYKRASHTKKGNVVNEIEKKYDREATN